MKGRKPIPMLGKRFGRLTVIAEHGRYKSGKVIYRCLCDCGNYSNVLGTYLRTGATISCGCYLREAAKERNRTHGKSKTRIYRIWNGMKCRCYNPNSKWYSGYGGRGITVCDEWRNSFETFYEWAMANGYADHLTIDRIDNNGNYCPKNCRWATAKEQGNNRNDCVFVEINGETKTLTQWATESGVKRGTIYSRYHRGIVGEDLIRKGRLNAKHEIK